MTRKSLVSDPVDPLNSQFGVSLFPRTIRVPSPAEPKNLESIHQLMKYVTSSSAEKVLEEAKAVVDGGSKFIESGYPKFIGSVGIEWDTFAREGKENVPERRPGLRSKRARFTLKTNASTRPSVILEPTLDFEQPCDAEEFFNAFEKTEEAKRELQRLNGGTISDFHKHDQPTNKRSRRPGILGYRKSYIYKHRESLGNNSSQMLSQDTQELNLPYESQTDEADTELEAQETNVSASATETEDEYNNILDGLFSENSEDLGGDCGASLIAKRLSIKPISLDTFLIPGLDVVGRTDFMAMREKLTKEKRTLTNISTLARRLSGGTPVKQKIVGGSPISPITSPTPPNVTVGSISLMKQRSSLCSPLRDPFSPLNIGMSESSKAFSGDDIDKQPPQLPVQNELSCSGNLEPRVEDVLSPKKKREGGSPSSPITSPTPPNVTVGSISLMKQRSSLRSPLRDPSSPLNIGISESRKAFSGDDIDKQPPQLPVQNELSCSGNLEPQVEDVLGSPTTDNVDLQTGAPRALESPINCFSVKNLEPQAEDRLGKSTTPRVVFQTLISRALDSHDGHFLDKSLGQGNTDDDIRPRESQSGVTERGTDDGLHENTTLEESINVPIALDRNIENVTERSEAAVLPSQFNSHADDSTQTESDTEVHQSHQVKEMPLKLDVHTTPEVNVSQLQAEENQTEGEPNTAATEENHVDAPSIAEDIMTMKTSEQVQPKKVTRKRPQGESRELKALRRRKSFAEAGTYIESGVRRSKRIKTRPLEYWKGERLLYGRIDESVKLVGLKYISPSRGERDLKVKPYISDDYKEVIDLASRY